MAKRNRKQKPATTTRITIHYTNGKTYTLPNVSSVTIKDSKSLQCTYSKDIEGSGITQKIDFNMTLEDVIFIEVRAVNGWSDSTITAEDGKVVQTSTWKSDNGVIRPLVQFVETIPHNYFFVNPSHTGVGGYDNK
ncbi:hypothetical protein VP249E411_P0138 [Vibrio phage 249E41-1]|nr:hypothetical protein VP249E411_P0138 [Vibrio phage 249E41-1]